MSKIFTYDPGTDVWGEAAVLPSPVVSGTGSIEQGKDSLLRIWISEVVSLVSDSMLGGFTCSLV